MEVELKDIKDFDQFDAENDLKYRTVEFLISNTSNSGQKLYKIPKFQRDSTCWNLTQKQTFIKSVLENCYIPPIVFMKKDNNPFSPYMLIDGLQRLTTLIEFYDNNFGVKFDDLNCEIYYDKCPIGKPHCYLLQSNERISKFLERKIPCYLAHDISLDRQIKVFERIQLSSPLNLDQLIHSKQFSGISIYEYIYIISESMREDMLIKKIIKTHNEMNKKTKYNSLAASILYSYHHFNKDVDSKNIGKYISTREDLISLENIKFDDKIIDIIYKMIVKLINYMNAYSHSLFEDKFLDMFCCYHFGKASDGDKISDNEEYEFSANKIRSMSDEFRDFEEVRIFIEDLKKIKHVKDLKEWIKLGREKDFRNSFEKMCDDLNIKLSEIKLHNYRIYCERIIKYIN
jgi:hypothetical protein